MEAVIIKARIIEDMEGWTSGNVRLAILRNGYVVMPDGTWNQFDEAESLQSAGITLPRDTIEAVAQAIEEWQGHAGHADTEARVLREWLASEKGRVDGFLGRMLGVER